MADIERDSPDIPPSSARRPQRRTATTPAAQPPFHTTIAYKGPSPSGSPVQPGPSHTSTRPSLPNTPLYHTHPLATMRIPALAFVLLAGALSASARLAKAPSSKAAAPGAAFLAARHDAPVADIQRRQDTTAGPATDTDPTTATDPTTDATDVVEEVDSVSAAPASDLPGPAADGTNVGKRQVPNADVPGVPEPNLSGVTDTVDGVLPVGAGAIGSK